MPNWPIENRTVLDYNFIEVIIMGIYRIFEHPEPDYKELYLTMVRASEKAARILIEAQQQCEERLLEAEEGRT